VNSSSMVGADEVEGLSCDVREALRVLVSFASAGQVVVGFPPGRPGASEFERLRATVEWAAEGLRECEP